MKFMVFLMLLFTKSAYAISEQNFLQSWHKEIAPYFTQGSQRSFVNQQGLKLNYYSFLSAKNKKTIVILTGFTEPALKYAEVVYDLKDLGFNIYLLDHQGQGASDRIFKNTDKGHVNQFSDYVRDLTDWLNGVVIPETKNQQRILLSHSMGGAIGSIYLSKRNDTFKKGIFVSPMMELNTSPFPEIIGRMLTSVLVFLSLGPEYAPGLGAYVAANDTFTKNRVTHSKGRFDLGHELYLTYPQLVVGGATNSWVNQSLQVTKNIDAIATKVRVPILMLQAGEDLIVKPSRQNAFCQKARNCKLIKYENAYHEILQESDSTRDLAMIEIRKFILD